VHSLFLRHRRVSWLLSALVIVAGWAVPLALPHYTVTARLDNATTSCTEITYR
jgi:hypothetical protein